MNAAAESTFASPGARTEFYLTGFGRLTDTVGRVIRERMHRMRRGSAPLSHERVSMLRETARMREAVLARAERSRVMIGRPAF